MVGGVQVTVSWSTEVLLTVRPTGGPGETGVEGRSGREEEEINAVYNNHINIKLTDQPPSRFCSTRMVTTPLP